MFLLLAGMDLSENKERRTARSLPLITLTTPLSLLQAKLDIADIRNKSWYLHIPLGHHISCADTPLTWIPITHFAIWLPSPKVHPKRSLTHLH